MNEAVYLLNYELNCNIIFILYEYRWNEIIHEGPYAIKRSNQTKSKAECIKTLLISNPIDDKAAVVLDWRSLN